MVLLALPVAAKAVITGGPEIPVNTTTANVQGAPTIAAGPSGGFTIAWGSEGQDGSGSGVYARRFNAAGEPLSGEIPVNTTTQNDQTRPTIAADGSGGFTVAWESWEQDGSYQGIFARRFNAAGEPVSDEIPVNTTTQSDQTEPTIAADGSGGFTVAWTSRGQDGSSLGVYARCFSAGGEPLSGEIPVNTTTQNEQYQPTIAMNPGGGFTIAWAGLGQEGAAYGVHARRFDATGTPLSGEIAVATDTSTEHHWLPAIAADSDGGFTVASSTPPSGHFDSSVQGAVPTLAIEETAIFARRFDATGAPLTGQITVVTSTVNESFFPVIAADPGGGFTVAWARYGQDGSGLGTFARRFDATGIALSGEIPVNTTTAGNQFQPTIAADGNGGFKVAWTGPDGEDYACWTEYGEEVCGMVPSYGIYARSFVDAPDTLINSGPAEGASTNDTTPTFTFSASEEGSRFECQVDGGEWEDCSSPFTPSSALSDGPHTFDVRATDEAEKTDPYPAKRSFTVDTVAPDTQIDSGLSGLIGSATPTFTFSSNEQTSSFQCRFDSDPFAACSGPGMSHTPPAPLADGPHTFEVRATDAAGNTDLSPASRSVTVDTTPPDTLITSGPSGPTNDATPTFTFSAGELDAIFKCSLDGAAAPCSSPYTAIALADGPHTFEVRATDAAGNTDLSAAFRSFTVDTTVPRTSINTGPAAYTNDPTPTLGFSSNEQGASFECHLDSDDYAPCSSPYTAISLADGPHTFEVRATDTAGNTTASPASRSFTVDTAAPDTAIDSGPSGATNDPTPTFTFSSTEQGGTFECRIDGNAYAPCSSAFTSPSPLSDGVHSFDVRATDPAANSDPSPASRSFTVDTLPPVVKLAAKKAQKAGRPIEVEVSCAEACAVVANGRIVVWVGGRRGVVSSSHGPEVRFGLTEGSQQLAAGKIATLRLGLKNGKAELALERLVSGGHKARAGLNVQITDRAGNLTLKRVTILLKAS